MSMHALALLVGGVALLAGVAVGMLLRRPRGGGEDARGDRILFPFVGGELSETALGAALRLARAQHATLMPAYLLAVPLSVPLDAPQPQACDVAFDIFERVEQRAAREGVRVDARIARGRNRRHAMRELMAGQHYSRIVAAAATDGSDGLSADEVAWLLRHATDEVIVLRPELSRARAQPAPGARMRRA